MKEHCFAFFHLSYWIELLIYVRFYCASFKASVGKYRIQKKKNPSKYIGKELCIYVGYKGFTLPSRKDSEDVNS